MSYQLVVNSCDMLSPANFNDVFESAEKSVLQWQQPAGCPTQPNLWIIMVMQNDKCFQLIGTCPGLEAVSAGGSYLEEVQKVASWAEGDGWDGLLIFTDNQQADPWLVAQFVLQCTTRLRPLVAVQPAYMHPFTAAKMVTTLVAMYDRAINLNFVAGAFMRDLPALAAWLPHDERYERVSEYATIMHTLLSRSSPFFFKGKHYEIKNLQLSTAINEALRPDYTMSGSSASGLAVAKQIGAVAVQYPKPAFDYLQADFDLALRHGVRLGIIVRETTASAWEAATSAFPPDPVGADVQEYVARTSDAEWLKKLQQGVEVVRSKSYWLGPLQNAQKSCPYLVGSFKEVADDIGGYMSLGVRHFLIEQPFNVEDSYRITEVFRLAASITIR